MKIENYLPKLAQDFPTLYIEGIKEPLQLLKQKIKVSKVAKELNVKENTLREALNGVSRCSLGLLKNLTKITEINLWDEIFKNASFLGGKTFTNKIKIPKEMTPELAYFAGALRDGAISACKSELVISQKSKEWLEKRIKPILEKIFGINCNISGPRKKDNCYYIKVRSVALFAIITTLLNWKKGQWRTPEIILQAPLEIQREYVKGFYEAEGSDNKKGGLEISQAWPSLDECPPLQDIKEILWKFNIESWFTKPQKGVNKPVHKLYVPKRYKETFFNTFQPNKFR